MGSVVSESLDLSDDRIVDYSCNGDRTDFLDLFLSAKCKLFLNSGSGIDALPKIFRTPQVGANITPLNYIGPNAVVFIPKKYWLVKEKRFLTFKEIIQSDIGYYLKSNEYINSGIELIENTADDIYYALVEANDRLNGVWEPDEQDIYMQKKFQDLFLPHPKLPNIRSPISAKFLRENSKLL
jgi:putative glycosyltransferase (TIGR04372 family)